jgi:tetratricopeptide (TPR) repeat protein
MVHSNQLKRPERKGQWQTLLGRLAALAFFLLSFISRPAFSEVLDPNKEYSEARLSGTGVERSMAIGQARATTPPTALSWFESKVAVAKVAISGVARSFFGPTSGPSVASTQAAPKLAPPRTPASSAAVESLKPIATLRPSDSVAQESLSFPGLSKSAVGVVKYDLAPGVEAIPRLRLPKEERLSSAQFSLDGQAQKTLESKIFGPLQSPGLMEVTELKALTRSPMAVTALKKLRSVAVQKGKVDDSVLAKIILNLASEAELKLSNFVELTADELRFLSGLLLYQQGHQCGAAVGLFHSVSQKKEWQAEADYFLASCSKTLGLMTDFSDRARRVFESGNGYYSARLLKEVDWTTPNVTTRAFGEALEKAMKNYEVLQNQTPETLATAAALITESSAAAEKFKTALEWSKKVPEDHPRYLQAKFVEALSEYQIGSKKRALELQEGLIKLPRADESAREFQGLIALNLARMYFQEQKYKEAHQAFLTVNKDHPLWLQGLAEMGWAQLLSNDYEGAIGNMYSIHSPYFAAAYKPESYVIQTIGYLHLCQYGDAYRTLTVLEKEYRSMLASIDAFERSTKSFSDGRYGTVRRFLVGFNQPGRTDVKDVDGLPSPVIREVARQKDFINLQKSLNRQIDERAVYAKIETEVDRSLKDAQGKVNQIRRRIEQIKKDIASIRSKPHLEPNRQQWNSVLQSELARLNDLFFSVDLFNEAKKSVSQYNREVVGGADRRVLEIKQKLESVITNRLVKVRTNLARYMDNNELLRYEVFAASGENIRFQVAGGEKTNRVPASAIPKSKSLQWDFDGEYWEDEIGHYRSSLKNNCPLGADQNRREQASNGGIK